MSSYHSMSPYLHNLFTFTFYKHIYCNYYYVIYINCQNKHLSQWNTYLLITPRAKQYQYIYSSKYTAVILTQLTGVSWETSNKLCILNWLECLQRALEQMHQRLLRLAAFIFIFSGSPINGYVFFVPFYREKQQVRVTQAEDNQVKISKLIF